MAGHYLESPPTDWVLLSVAAIEAQMFIKQQKIN